MSYNGLSDVHLQGFLHMKGFRRNILKLRKVLQAEMSSKIHRKHVKTLGKSVNQELPKIEKLKRNSDADRIVKCKTKMKTTIRNEVDVAKSIYFGVYFIIVRK